MHHWTDDRKSLFGPGREKVENCPERPLRARLRGPRATAAGANEPGLRVSGQYPITACYVNPRRVFQAGLDNGAAEARGDGVYINWL
jgi:hypothetical protein